MNGPLNQEPVGARELTAKQFEGRMQILLAQMLYPNESVNEALQKWGAEGDSPAKKFRDYMSTHPVDVRKNDEASLREILKEAGITSETVH